ncbi:uncharacterized protein LOC119831233 [Zerene cesonia]|uniref:uncharacterized protein LOC119831233 n=1 Tax=Zerene cesonia TaxID=33412 RepID=UPI0018E5126D|nr:uncharacterized protein LOC119831233 [Zerene cesonia]
MLLEENKIFRFHSDTIDVVRREINLSQEEDMREAIKILREWVHIQPHFKIKDFPDSYLERWIVASKGSVEKAKSRLDRMCTIRTLIPHYFIETDVTRDFNDIFDKVIPVICPKLTKEHHRVIVTKSLVSDADAEFLTKFYKYSIYICELLRRYDYGMGLHSVYDVQSLDIVKLMTKINVVEFRNILTILLEGYGMRVKGIHIIIQSKSIELLLNIAKTILKPKIISRIHVHKSYEELHEIIGKDVIPIEFGGNERSIFELHDDLIEVASTKEFKEWYSTMLNARTDEELRPNGKFNEEYAGTPGTFRMLNLD